MYFAEGRLERTAAAAAWRVWCGRRDEQSVRMMDHVIGCAGKDDACHRSACERPTLMTVVVVCGVGFSLAVLGAAGCDVGAPEGPLLWLNLRA